MQRPTGPGLTRAGIKGAATATACMMALTACASRGSEAEGGAPGVTDDTITLGTSTSYSGPVAAYATLTGGMDAYFSYVNEVEGGVEMADGVRREIELIAYDDGFDPARASANARRLVEQDNVFALVSTVGSDPSVAMMEYLNAKEVPQTFIVTQSTNFGAHAEEFPWSIGFMPTIATESGVFVQDLVNRDVTGEAAILHVADAGGRSHLAGLKAALSEGSPVTVGPVDSFQESDPTINTQLSELGRNSPPVFFDLAPPKFAAQAIQRLKAQGWEPRHYLASQSNSVEATLKPAGLDNSKGVLSVAWMKDPADPAWAGDPDVKQYEEIIEKYGDDLNSADLITVQGYIQGEAVVRALEKSEPTRDSYMAAVRSMDTGLAMMLPDIKAVTGPDDPFPLESLYLSQFDGERWVLDGDEPVDLEGRTPMIEDAG